MEHSVKMYYTADTPYPVEIRNGRVHYIIQVLACLFILGVILAFMSTIGQAERAAAFFEYAAALREEKATGIRPEIAPKPSSINLKNIALNISCIALAGFLALITIVSGILVFKDPVVIKFDAQGILLMNIGVKKIKDVRINWSDVSSVDIYSYKRLLHEKNRHVDLILHDDKILKKFAVQDIAHLSNKTRKIKHNMRGTIRLKYTGAGMGFSHIEYFEFIKSELLKHQSKYPVTSTSRKKLIRPSKRLFG